MLRHDGGERNPKGGGEREPELREREVERRRGRQRERERERERERAGGRVCRLCYSQEWRQMPEEEKKTKKTTTYDLQTLP